MVSKILPLFSCFVNSKEVVKVGYFNTALPMLSDKNGVLMGTAVDYYEDVAEELNIDIEWVGHFGARQ